MPRPVPQRPDRIALAQVSTACQSDLAYPRVLGAAPSTGPRWRHRDREPTDGRPPGPRTGTAQRPSAPHRRRRPGPPRPGRRRAPGRHRRTHLDRPVRWVHITELTDPASFLKGGELVLTTGMPLPGRRGGGAPVRRRTRRASGPAALVIELVRRYHRPPEALVDACRRAASRSITLAQDVNFLEVTQVVHALILGNQAEAMRRTQRIHEAFTALTLRGAGPGGRGARGGRDERPHGRPGEPGAPGTDLRALRRHAWRRRSPAGSSGPERPRPATAPDRAVRRAGSRHRSSTRANAGAGWPCCPTRTDWPAFGPEDSTVLERTAMALTVARLIHPAPLGAHRAPQRPARPGRAAPPLPRGRPRPAARRWACRREQAAFSRSWWTSPRADTTARA